jgi:hypothetical protein
MTSLAPEFQHDVFVSYSHGDVAQTGKALMKIWSQGFAKELVNELLAMPGLDKSDVFLDERGIDPAGPLTSQLRESVVKSAILLVLMSPHYLKSEACANERAWWFEKAAGDAFPEVRSRLLTARIWPVADNDWPRELCDEASEPPIGIWFHERPGDPIKSRPFGWPDPTGAKGEFRAQLVELAGEIAIRLSELQQSVDRRKRAAAEAEKLGAATGQAIYVHARQHDMDKWEVVREQLIAAGYGVVPGGPEILPGTPLEFGELEDENLRTLIACDGLLLVPGDNPNHLASDLVVVGHQRRNSARAKSRKPLPCAVIDYGQIGKTRTFLQQNARNMQIDWISASASDWTRDVRNWLNTAASRTS